MKFYLVTCFNNTKLNIFSKILMWADGIDSSHCEIMTVDFEGDKNFFGAVFPFSRLATEKEFSSHYTITHQVELPVKDYKKAIWYLNAQMAKPYSFLQIGYATVKVIFKVLMLSPFKAKVNANKHLVCTELCADFMRDQAGFDFSDNNDLVTISELKEKAGIK
jgi:hypothetical protein